MLALLVILGFLVVGLWAFWWLLRISVYGFLAVFFCILVGVYYTVRMGMKAFYRIEQMTAEVTP